QCWPNIMADSNYAGEYALRTSILWQPLDAFYETLHKACQTFSEQKKEPSTPMYAQLKTYYQVLHTQGHQLINSTLHSQLQSQFTKQAELWHKNLTDLMGNAFCTSDENIEQPEQPAQIKDERTEIKETTDITQLSSMPLPESISTL